MIIVSYMLYVSSRERLPFYIRKLNSVLCRVIPLTMRAMLRKAPDSLLPSAPVWACLREPFGVSLRVSAVMLSRLKDLPPLSSRLRLLGQHLPHRLQRRALRFKGSGIGPIPFDEGRVQNSTKPLFFTKAVHQTKPSKVHHEGFGNIQPSKWKVRYDNEDFVIKR
jgi:hypothetical protein